MKFTIRLTILFIAMATFTFAQSSLTWRAVGSTGFSDGAIQYSSMVVDTSGTPSVAYVDGGASGSGYADYPMVRKFNGSGWANAAPNVIDNNLSDNTTWNTSLAFDKSGKLYLAFKDVYLTGKITVKNDANGVAWGNVGQPGFTAGSVEYISLAIAPDGTPYVAYEDGANSSKASVMKWTGSGWANVGTAGFSAGSANYTSLAFNGSGTPYIAFKDNANSSKATVMKFNGTSWEIVGSAGFSAGAAYSTSLKIDNSGTPYVAYQDNGNGAKATVMKFDGTNWVAFGSAGFSSGAVSFTQLAIDDNGTLYVAFQDRSTPNQNATVMKYDSVNDWSIAGSANFSDGQVEHLSLAVEGTGLPYMSYRDNANGGKITVMHLEETENPVIVNNTGLTLAEGATATIDSSALLTTDADTEPGSLIYTITTATSFGEIQKSGSFVSSFTQADLNNGLLTYVNDGSENIIDLFSFTLNDGTFQTAVQQFIIGITPVNDAPVIENNIGITLNPGVSSANIDSSSLSASDAEGDALTFTVTTLPTNGTVQNNGVDIALNGTFSQDDLNNALISYTHDGSATISDEFTFSVSDGADELTDQVFNITIIDKAWELLGSAGFSAGSANFLSVKLGKNGLPYALYMDSGNFSRATLMKFDGTNWVNVGSAGFSSNAAYYTSLAIDSSGTPYVAFNDGDNSYNVSVMKYDGTAWDFVGSAGFAPKPGSGGPIIEIDSIGTPYVAFKGNGYYDGGSVMKYDGTNWVTVGGAAFSTDQAFGVELALDGNGMPYVAYRDGGSRNQASVKKFNGSSWEIVGAAKFTAGEAGNIDLALDSNNMPYIAYYGPYYDATNNSKAAVMKFDGVNWVNVGTTGFSIGAAFYPSLSINSTGTPYLAFQDRANSNKATIMNYNGTEWVAVGGAGISEGSASFLSLVIDNNDALFVAYTDGANSSKVTVMQRGWTAPNQTPTIGANTGLTLNEGSSAAIDNAKLKATDSDSEDGLLVFTITTATTNGEVQLSGTAATTFTQADIDAGNVTYVHNGGETTSDSFTFSLSDGADEITGQTFSITVTPVNDAPVVAGIPDVSFPEDSSYAMDLDAFVTDTDNDTSQINWTVSSPLALNAGRIQKKGNKSGYLFLLPNHGGNNLSIKKTGAKRSLKKNIFTDKTAGSPNETQSSGADSIIVTIDGQTHKATFTATLNYNISDVPFAFTATDPDNASDKDTITVTVTSVNDPMVISVNAGITLNEGSDGIIDSSKLRASDADIADSLLIFTIDTTTVNGEIQLSGTAAATFTQADINGGKLKYVHNSGETTSDRFIFTVSGGGDIISNQKFDITVTPVNDAPENTQLPAISGTAVEQQSLNVDDGLWTDADNDSLVFTYQWYIDDDSLDYDGTAITDSTGSAYTCSSNDIGKYLYAVITANDGNGSSVSANSNYTSAVTTLVSVEKEAIPAKYSLSQNYPNPFNPSTTFKYGLKEESDVVLEIYNLLGERVLTLVKARQAAGNYELSVDMNNLSSGIYIYRIRAGKFVRSMKMILLK